jgi:hypothetical protein
MAAEIPGTRPRSDCHRASTRMRCYRSATPRAGSGQSDVSRSTVSSTKIGGPSLPRLNLASMRRAAAYLDGQFVLALAQIDDMA